VHPYFAEAGAGFSLVCLLISSAAGLVEEFIMNVQHYDHC